LPLIRPPLEREHRLYQADWLMRFYGYEAAEITAGTRDGFLDLDIDPKLAWALQNRGHFPVDINKGSRKCCCGFPASACEPSIASSAPVACSLCGSAILCALVP
jgi:predicted DNA-binding helix-hairpin-helix protein